MAAGPLTSTIVAVGAALVLGACASSPVSSRPDGGAARSGWEARIEPADRDRLLRLPDAWSSALGQAREAGHTADLADLGALVEPGAALPDPSPPPGSYRCRTIKIGAQGGLLPFVAYTWFDCAVTDSAGTLRLDKLTGSQRQHGIFHPDTDRRLVFLGTLALGSDEAGGPPYGIQHDRNIVGVLERIGPARWRLVQPWPYFESNLDLLELVPRPDP